MLRRFTLVLVTVLTALTGMGARTAFAKMTPEEVLALMTLEDKVNLVVGTLRDYVYWPEPAPGMPVRSQGPVEDSRGATAFTSGDVEGAAGETYAIERLGIPSIVLADGPAGVRIDATRADDEMTYYCTAFPNATLLAATWDTDMVNNVGAAVGSEAQSYGVDILLAPGINIIRNPLGGRNFEYYSEDPFLAGKMGASFIRGVQSNGVGATVKHFVANNQETTRNGIDVVVSQRALRDIYLEPFRIAVTEGKPMAVMTAYNKVNGTVMPENRFLLTEILRDEWGFDGFVMTDWWAEGSGDKQIAAGNDMLMPGTWRQYDEIMKAIEVGSLDIEKLDQSVLNILRAIKNTPTGAGRRHDNKPDLESHATLARQVATQGMVLLKNNDKTLPLENRQKVALFGNGSYDTFIGGTGSSKVNNKYKVNIAEGLESAGKILDPSLSQFYTKHISDYKADKPADDMWNTAVTPEAAISQEEIIRAANNNDVAIITIARMAGESADRTLTEGDWFLSDAERQNLVNITSAFHELGKPVVVLLNMGSIVDMTDWNDLPDAILHIWLPGQEAGHAVADVLSGKVNPSGRLPFTIARRYQDYGSANEFPHSENPATVYYTDDIFVGYRHFYHNKIAPLYKFGHGLSYTVFHISIIRDRDETDPDMIVVDVTNTGDRNGAFTFLSFEDNELRDNPTKQVYAPYELIGFGKTKVLSPGETQRLRVKIR